MILTLILGIAAGAGARPAVPHVTEALIRFIGVENLPGSEDRQVASLLACLLAGSVVLALVGEPGRLVLFVLGAGLGYFQQALREVYLNRGR
ncbi:hypothetical protein [Pseudoponticoccus marisrubri]|uniref:Uncharacterized protein n=1 Tax=Pseudoponticoccus marisrubri TaxID=1685382 RepID=A0A0W7WLG1_9RHOB|nr:hypothetical protein [Pseudoponticoccus marisrubri]KUF11426.1 hypothetical protein AVJ23_06575 [Pseudoponticoccus marisrubri]